MREEEAKRILLELDSLAMPDSWFGCIYGYNSDFSYPEFARHTSSGELPRELCEAYMQVLGFVLILFEEMGLVERFSGALPDGLKCYDSMVRFTYLKHHMDKYGWRFDSDYTYGFYASLNDDTLLPYVQNFDHPSRNLMMEVIDRTYGNELPDDLARHRNLKRFSEDELDEAYCSAIECWFDDGSCNSGFLTLRNRKAERFLEHHREYGVSEGWMSGFHHMYETASLVGYEYWNHREGGRYFYINMVPECVDMDGPFDVMLHEHVPLSKIEAMRNLDEMIREARKGGKKDEA